MGTHPLQTLEGIRREMAAMRKKHSEQAQLYILNKLKYEVLATNFILKDANGKSMAEKEREAKNFFISEYSEYKKAKALVEGYDREFKNLDSQRSIIMVRIKSMEGKN